MDLKEICQQLAYREIEIRELKTLLLKFDTENKKLKKELIEKKDLIEKKEQLDILENEDTLSEYTEDNENEDTLSEYTDDNENEELNKNKFKVELTNKFQKIVDFLKLINVITIKKTELTLEDILKLIATETSDNVKYISLLLNTLEKIKIIEIKFSKNTFSDAIHNKSSFQLIQLLYKMKCPFGDDTFNYAIKNGDIEIIKFLLEKGCPYTSQCEITLKNLKLI